MIPRQPKHAIVATAAAALLGLASAGPARAELLDPATLHIGNGATGSCPTGTGSSPCTGVYGGELTAITGHSVSLYQESGGASSLQDPVLLLLEVPVFSNGIHGSISASSISSPASEYASFPGPLSSTPAVTFGTTAYGLGASGGLVGEMTSGDLYSFLGSKSSSSADFGGLDASINIPNMTGADSAVRGLTGIQGYDIYAFAVDTADFAGQSLLDFTTSSIPDGTFYAGFGLNDTHNYGAQFTNAGIDTCGVHVGSASSPAASLVRYAASFLISPAYAAGCPPTSVPEPSSLAVLGTVLAVLGGFGMLGIPPVLRRRRRA